MKARKLSCVVSALLILLSGLPMPARAATSLDPNYIASLLTSGLSEPANGLVFRPATNDLLVSAFSGNGIFSVSTVTGVARVFAGVLSPDEMAINSLGEVFSKTQPGGPITMFSSTGAFLGTFNVPGSPTGIAFDRSDNFYVADDSSGTIYRYAAGTTASPAVYASGFLLMEGMEFSPTGQLFIVDNANNVLYQVTPGGTTLASHKVWASGLSSPFNMAWDPCSGVMFVSNSTSVVKVPSPGVVTTFAKGFSQAYDLDFDNVGNAYVDDNSAGQIWKFTTSRPCAPGISAGSWYPAGPQMETLTINTFASAVAEYNALSTGQNDMNDWPLSGSQIGTTCPGIAFVNCSLTTRAKGYSGIEFNLNGVFWGIPFGLGNPSNVAGIQLRQGISHLINKVFFANSECMGAGVPCLPNDDPTPPFTIVSGGSGLPSANPCNWDTGITGAALFTETNANNCVVGSPGGTAYNCATPNGANVNSCANIASTSGIGSSTYSWQPRIGSTDFCAAAQHFVIAFDNQLGLSLTLNSACEINPPTGGWPSSVFNLPVSCSGMVAKASVCFFVRADNAGQNDLGLSLSQEMCALFSPAWVAGGWTTLSGNPVSCDNTNTGATPQPFVQIVSGPVNAFCGFSTSTTGTPSNCWGMYTSDFANVFPFDRNLFFTYNSQFASKTAGCSSNVLSPRAGDWMYLCSSEYDAASTSMEYANCISSPPATNPDPTLGSATPTFATCGGASFTGVCGVSSMCTALSSGYQAEALFGSNAFAIPVWTDESMYPRLSNWPLGGASPGVVDAFGGSYEAQPNFFNWLNAYSPNATVAGTIRQGFEQSPTSLNPFVGETRQDFYVLNNVYDTLFKANPLCGDSPIVAGGVNPCTSTYQLIDWMTTSHSFLCYSGGAACTPTTLGYGNSTFFLNTSADIRLSLNRNNHWHDGGPVTAWDLKYALTNLLDTGAFQAGVLADVDHIIIIDEFTVDLNLKAKGPFTEFFIGGITMIPGHVWSTCGASTWNIGVTGKNVAGSSVVSAAEDACVGSFGSPNIITINGVRADSPTFDPVANNFLIGSGPWSCQSIGGTGHPTVGTIGGGCSIDNTQSPSPTLGAYTLTRTGCALTATGTMCGVAGSGNDYIRGSGGLARYIWTGDIGSGSADFSKVLTVNSCHSATPSANCPHWAQGIGNPSLTSIANPVGLSQRLAVTSLKGVSWIAFSTEKTTGTQLIFTCAAGYTLPGTTITPCTATNAGWTESVLPGIGAYPATLYEVGSHITIGTTTTGTSTLAPASAIGCTSDYPIGGYDC